ncbi:MAG: DUF169 domain-containing protein [Candidatus Rokuibacteriota bacterium]
MDRRESAERISAGLGLDTPPIAIAFAHSPPAGVKTFVGEVPSACTFWRQAETAVFYAPAGKHMNCPIGAMTMGFDMPDDVHAELMGLVTKMCELGYISPQEPERIPTSGKKPVGITYGPLRDFPVDPDVVLIWLTPRQAMFYNEAVGDSRWTTTSPATVRGRPACAALPQALRSAQATLSLGCTGMRTFTDVSDDRLLAVLPGDRAGDLAKSLESTMKSNDAMELFYRQHKAKFAGVATDQHQS